MFMAQLLVLVMWYPWLLYTITLWNVVSMVKTCSQVVNIDDYIVNMGKESFQG